MKVVSYILGCIHGNVRLQGNVSTEGRVEVCVDNIWGTICETDWNTIASAVVCIQLGLPSSGIYNAYIEKNTFVPYLHLSQVSHVANSQACCFILQVHK